MLEVFLKYFRPARENGCAEPCPTLFTSRLKPETKKAWCELQLSMGGGVAKKMKPRADGRMEGADKASDVATCC